MLFSMLLLGFLCFCFVNLLVNLCIFRSLKEKAAASQASLPKVSILIPARNESRNIEACLHSVKEQQYPDFEVLLLDDQSEDDTAQLAIKLGFTENGEAQFRLMRGQPLPQGWTGKGWACHQLSQAAKGEYFLFIDADTTHSPHVLASAMAMADETGADLLSAWPRLITKTWGEKLVIPILQIPAMILYPHFLFRWLQHRPHIAARLPEKFLRQLGAANGQFLFFKRAAYEKIGGHKAVHFHLVEDVALGREVSRRMGEGMRLVNCDGSALSTCRMYHSFGEVWEGFTKNSRALFEDALGQFLMFGALVSTVFLLPFFLVWMSGGIKHYALISICIIYVMRLLTALRFRTTFVGALFHPLGMMLALLIGLDSWRKSTFGGVSWKGRRYRPFHRD